MADDFGIVETMSAIIKKGLSEVRGRIERAAERCGRDPGGITLVAVSKMHPSSAIRAAMKNGVIAFGENKVQEAESKIEEIGTDAAEWHLIGHLQKNKARKAVQLFDVIHSVDSPELAQRLDRICEEEGRQELRVLIQVDLAGEANKEGVPERQLQMLVECLKRCAHLKLVGLMILPPFFDDPEAARPFFKRLRTHRDRLAREGVFTNGSGELSMGMSHDLEVAIEEGATIVRVGTAIFGARGK